MSADSIPYHLRSHKTVDRRLFVDFLSRFERWKEVSDYIYASMGAYALEDHKLAHRVLGLTKLISFDKDQTIVARQNFNRPVSSCKCLVKTSGQFVADIENVISDCGFQNYSGIIVWLDYTNPKKIGEQIREFQSLLDKLAPGDVVRVTVNAHPLHSLDEDKNPDTEKEQKDAKNKRLLDRLKNLISDYLPPDTAVDDMAYDRLPLRLSQSFASAALKAFPPSGNVKFCPLSIVRYADSTQMLSITGAIVEKSNEVKMKSALSMHNWALYSKDWTDIHQLVVPALTLRERLFLEREVGTKTESELLEDLNFFSGSSVNLSAFIHSYKKYYRFYPTLLSADI